MRNLLKLIIFILLASFPISDTTNPYLEANLSVNEIFPGTKWCGPGNIAKNYDDLGTLAETDKCCRAHDYCPIYIKAGGIDFGLNNRSSYTRYLCSCDETFRQCLRVNVENKKNPVSSEAVGIIYFDLSQPQCFKKDHLIVKCKVYIPFTNRCKEYEQDMTSPLTWQWFDDPLFYQ